MKFIVSRVSIRDESSPCEEAKQEDITRVETCTFRTPEEYDTRFVPVLRKKWCEEGTNHRLNEEGFITRDFYPFSVYTIEINSLDDLMDFCDKYGELVIGSSQWNPSYKEITIYDDYME